MGNIMTVTNDKEEIGPIRNQISLLGYKTLNKVVFSATTKLFN